MEGNTFNQKLKAGLQGEEIARVYLESLGHKVSFHVELPHNPALKPEALHILREADFHVNGKPVEVKLDILSAKTGNICIEHQSLKTHTAPYYIWEVVTFYKTTRRKLEHLVASHPDKVSAGDDGRAATLVKIDSEWFRENFIRL